MDKNKAEGRIGDASRDKWVAFLGRCFELGYISDEEREERVAAMLDAKTMADIRAANRDFDHDTLKEWNDYWEKLRRKGQRPQPGVVPVPYRSVSRNPTPHALIWTIVALMILVLTTCIIIVVAVV